MSDIIYVLTNPKFPGLVKIGFTTNLKSRIRTLSTSVPEEFDCYYFCEVEKGTGKDVEKRLHFAFEDLRAPKGEFFEINPKRVKAILELLAIQNTTSDRDTAKNKDASNKKHKKAPDRKRRKKAPYFTFSMLKIPIGSKLVLSKDKTKTATVIEDRKVRYRGKEDLLSPITKKILKNLDIKWVSVQGPDEWLFEGETLTKRRKRLEDSSD